MKIQDSSFFCEAIRFIGYGARFGWHERNAGNISLRLCSDEVNDVYECFDETRNWIELPVTIPTMGGEYIFTSASGSYFLDSEENAENKFCICNISHDGSRYRVVWGAERPTSELCGHLLSLAELKSRGARRAVYHAHPANIIALSYLVPHDDKAISEAIWESETECAFVVPNGIGVVGFCVPGSLELAKVTADKVKHFNAVLWSFHGIFATGESICDAFGLAHAIEKAAEIKLKVITAGNPLHTITKEQQKETAAYYGFVLNEFKD